jgi:hypothetical protein
MIRIIFKLQVLYNRARRFLGLGPIGYDLSTLRYLESGVQIIHGVDLNIPQHGHDEVQTKRFFINFLLDETGWSISELHRNLVCAGFDVKGLSRRSLNYYVTTHEEALTDKNISSAFSYKEDYVLFSKSLKSIL